VDGILGHNLLLSRAFVHNLFFFHDGILAIRKPFSRTFSFSRWNFGYHEAFLTNFFFFHDGILAITKPFSRFFFFFHDGYHEAFLTNFFLFSRWLSRSLSHELFSFFTMEFWKYAIGGRLFIYIYITKSIYRGSASLKTLPLDLEPPLQGKEYGPPYSNATRKRKANVFPEITYRQVIRIF
jgi:hypothetical protein